MTPRLLWGIGGLFAFLGCSVYAGLGQDTFANWHGLPLLGRFLKAAVQPNVQPNFLRLVLRESLTTFAYAVCGSSLSLVMGCIGGLFASQIWWKTVFPRQTPTWPRALIRAILAVPRAIHEAIWGLFFISIFGLDPLSALLALSIPFGAITAKVFADILDDTPDAPLINLLSSGCPPFLALCYGLLPIAFLNLLSYAFYRFECALRAAVVLGIIGAGGLGYQIDLSLQSLRYEQLWTLFYALIVLNGSVDLASGWVRKQLGAPTRLALNQKSIKKPPNQEGQSTNSRSSSHRFKGHYQVSRKANRERLILSGLFTVVLIAVPASFAWLSPDWSRLWSPRTVRLLGDMGSQVLPLPWRSLDFGQLSQLSLQTLVMSFLAIVLAAIGGMALAFPAARTLILPGGILNPHVRSQLPNTSHGHRYRSWGRLLLARLTLLVARAIPAPVWALVALFVLYPGVWPGAIALGIHNMGILGRLMGEAIENLDQRPLVALKAQGTPKLPLFFYGILPATILRFIAYALYRWEVCLRETIVVGIVGAGGLGWLLKEQLSSFDYGAIVITLICFVVLTVVVDRLSDQARSAIQ